MGVLKIRKKRFVMGFKVVKADFNGIF